MENLAEKSGGKWKGTFIVECYRKGKLIWTETPKDGHNVFTAEGLTHMLAVTLGGKTLIDPFYAVLYEDNAPPADADTYAIPGYTECGAGVDEATREIYVDVVTSKSCTNAASKASYTFNAAKTIYGAALVGGSSTKADVTDAATHVLLCGGNFTASRAVVDDDVINLTYQVTSADDGA